MHLYSMYLPHTVVNERLVVVKLHPVKCHRSSWCATGSVDGMGTVDFREPLRDILYLNIHTYTQDVFRSGLHLLILDLGSLSRLDQR